MITSDVDVADTVLKCPSRDILAQSGNGPQFLQAE
jgi:hypothetical protein